MQDRTTAAKEAAKPSPPPLREQPAEAGSTEFAGAGRLARSVLRLQRERGNRYVQRMIGRGGQHGLVRRQTPAPGEIPAPAGAAPPVETPAPAEAPPAAAQAPAPAGEAAKKPDEVPPELQISEENVVRTVESLFGPVAAAEVRAAEAPRAGAAIEVQIPIDEALLTARSINQELAIRFFNLASPVEIKRWEAERLIQSLAWKHLATEEKAREMVAANLEGGKSSIGYQTSEGALPGVRVGLYRLRAISHLRLERIYADLRNVHYAEDAIASFYIAHVNGAIEVLSGLLDLPVAPYNLVQRLRGKEGVKFLGDKLRTIKIEDKGEYGKKYGGTLETGVVVGFAVFGLRGGGGAGAGSALGLSRGAAAPEAAGALARVLARVSNLTVEGVKIGPALEKILRLTAVVGQATDVGGAVLDVRDAVKELRSGVHIEADGKVRPLTEDDVVNILVKLFMAGVTFKQALPEGKGHQAPPTEPGAPEPHAAGQAPKPAAPEPTPEPAAAPKPPAPEATAKSPEAPPAAHVEPEAAAASKPAEAAAPGPKPEEAARPGEAPAATPEAPAAAPARPAPPHTSIDELITPDGKGFNDPQLQASYEKYLGRKEKQKKPPADPKTWASLTREGPRERLEQLVGADYDFSLHATGKPQPPVKLAEVAQPADYTPAQLNADIATVTADHGQLFHRLSKLVAEGVHGGEISHALFNILKGNIGEILARPLQMKRLGEIQAAAPDARLFTDVRARLIEKTGPGGAVKLSDPVLFTDNVIASQRPGGLQIHSVFEVKAGSHGGQEATSQIHRWIEKHLDDGFEIYAGGQWYRYGPQAEPGKGVVGLARGERQLIAPRGAEHYGKGSEDRTVTAPGRQALPRSAEEINFLTRTILERLVPNHPATPATPAPATAPSPAPAPAAPSPAPAAPVL